MKITPIFDCVVGSFNTETNKMVCVPSDNKGKISLCLKEEGSNWNFPIGEIVLYDSGKYVDFKATFVDAKKLGDEICRRYNECTNKK